MKNTLILLVLVSGVFSIASCQEDVLTPDLKRSTINKMSILIEEQYVFPDVADATTAHLKKALENGDFEDYNTPQSFATALTKEVQSINKDKHMRVISSAEFKQRNKERSQQKKAVKTLSSAKVLDKNIGYIDLRTFTEPKSVIDDLLQTVAETDALIIDVRENGGGSPEIVQYLCSYFFLEKTHLNSLYYRPSDKTTEFWTLDEVNGEKMLAIPLYILTSSYTFSAAEEFCYNMQTRNMATLVGETTGGGANPGGIEKINNQFMIFIPTGKAINPVTNTNWENVGVVPEEKISSEKALGKAQELAVELIFQ